MFYPEVDKYYQKDPYLKEKYGKQIWDCMEKLRNQISKDMHYQICCKDNRYEDLYEVFIEKIEQLFEVGTSVTDDAFVLYNVMHQEKFYHIWTNDLLRHIMRYKRRK